MKDAVAIDRCWRARFAVVRNWGESGGQDRQARKVSVELVRNVRMRHAAVRGSLLFASTNVVRQVHQYRKKHFIRDATSEVLFNFGELFLRQRFQLGV